MMRRAAWLVAPLLLLAVSVASAQTATAPAPQPSAAPPAPPAPRAQHGSIFWFVGGVGFEMARANCPTCAREGVTTDGRSLLVNAGFRLNPRLDAGIELSWGSSKLHENSEPILATFVLGVGQVRPWLNRGFFLKAGTGIGFVGNGLAGPIGPAFAPPFTTNTLALMYGAGWVFQRERRFTMQVYGAQHVAALGELTTVEGDSIKNIVGNSWSIGIGFVFR